MSQGCGRYLYSFLSIVVAADGDADDAMMRDDSARPQRSRALYTDHAVRSIRGVPCLVI